MSSESLTRRLRALWWLPLIKGVLAPAAGVMALVWPDPTMAALVVVLGIYVLVDAVLNLVDSRLLAGLPGRRALVSFGILGLLAGGFMVWHPGPAMRVVVVLVGAWVLLLGMILLGVTLMLVPFSRRAWISSLLAGLVCLGLGVAALTRPGFGVTAMGWLIGLGVIAYGGAHIGLALGLRHLTAVIGRGAGPAGSGTVIEGEVVSDHGEPEAPSDDPQITGGR